MGVDMLVEPTPGPQLPTLVTSGVFSGTHLFAKFKCSFCQNPHQGSGWPGHAGQPSTTSGPPRGNFGGSPCNPQNGWLLDALDLQGLGEWPEAEQEQARELLLKQNTYLLEVI